MTQMQSTGRPSTVRHIRARVLLTGPGAADLSGGSGGLDNFPVFPAILEGTECPSLGDMAAYALSWSCTNGKTVIFVECHKL